MGPRPIPETIRELALLADGALMGPITLARLANTIACRDFSARDFGAAKDALEAASILRRLDDGTLDVATLLDEPCSNLDAAREAYVQQYEGQLDAACRALAGES